MPGIAISQSRWMAMYQTVMAATSATPARVVQISGSLTPRLPTLTRMEVAPAR